MWKEEAEKEIFFARVFLKTGSGLKNQIHFKGRKKELTAMKAFLLQSNVTYEIRFKQNLKSVLCKTCNFAERKGCPF